MLSSTYGLYSSVDPAAIPQFAPAYAQELLAAHGDEWVVVDVRSAQDYGRAHLPGAASLCYASLVVALESQRPALETLAASGRGIMTYANTGGSEGPSTSRDLMAMSALVEVAGVHPARLARLEGGLDAWRAAGLPLTSLSSERIVNSSKPLSVSSVSIAATCEFGRLPSSSTGLRSAIANPTVPPLRATRSSPKMGMSNSGRGHMTT